MARSERILDYLRSVETPLADEALAAAIARVPREGVAPLAEALLVRNRPASFRALVESYEALSPEIRKRMGQSERSLMPAVAEVLRSGQSQPRVNALSILRDSISLRHAGLAADALADRSAAVRKSAAQTLRTMTDLYFRRATELQRTVRDGGANASTDAGQIMAGLAELSAERQVLAAALRDAVRAFTTHHQLDVIEAGMFMVEDLHDTLFEHVSGRRGRCTHAMLEIFTRSADPRLAPFAYHSLAYPELRPGVLGVLVSRREQPFFEAMIRRHEYTLLSHVRKPLATLHHLAWLDDGVAPLMALPEELHTVAVAWITKLGLPEDSLLDLLRGIVDYDSPAALRRAAWVAIRYRSPPCMRVLRALAECDDADAARIARMEIQRRESRRAAILPTVGVNVEAGARWSEFLRRCRVEATFESFWNHTDQIDTRGSGVSGTDVLKRVDNFYVELRARLCGAAVQDRIKAYELIMALDLEERFQDDLFPQADDPDPAIRAHVLGLLARIPNATSRRILERSVGDSDARVRAAAIEGVVLVGGSRSQSLVAAHLTDDAPPVRAAAIRVLLQRRVHEAAHALVNTLSDVMPTQRLAALSLAAQLKLTALSPRIIQMAEQDPDEQVRQRAGKLIRSWTDEGLLAPAPARAPGTPAEEAASTEPQSGAPAISAASGETP